MYTVYSNFCFENRSLNTQGVPQSRKIVKLEHLINFQHLFEFQLSINIQTTKSVYRYNDYLFQVTHVYTCTCVG